MDGATAAAWAQAVGTVASAGAAVVLIRQERRSRQDEAERWGMEERRRREDRDRETVRELAGFWVRIGTTGVRGDHWNADILIDNNTPIGFARVEVDLQLEGPIDGIEAAPVGIREVLDDLGPRGTIRREHRLPWRDTVEWTWSALLIETNGARWMADDRGFVRRVPPTPPPPRPSM